MNKYLLYLVILIFCSCGAIYGLKKSHHINESERIGKDNRIGIVSALQLTEKYKDTLRSLHLPDAATHDMLQPLQLWIIKGPDLICNTVNCYASGFPNLNWNISQVYEKKKIYTKFDDVLRFTGNIKSIYGIMPSENDTIAIICYAHFMGRQNKIFIKECNDFLQMHPAIKKYYVNIDNIF